MIETDYIAYLETKVSTQDYRIKELESTLMLVAFSEANKVNRDLIYLLISKRVYETMPFSRELIDTYKKLLSECKAEI
jgi:hypothetical protein